jgi:ATP-dependent Clp protease protease subunit
MSEQDEVARKLLADRVVAIFEPIDAQVAERAIGQLVYLEQIDDQKEMTLSLSTPGGSVSAGLQILQVMAQLQPPVRTVVLDRCGGVATLLLAAGTRGARTARQGARISLDPLSRSAKGEPADLQVEQLRRRLVALFSALTGQGAERIGQDFELELELTAEGARKYGIVDEVFTKEG